MRLALRWLAFVLPVLVLFSYLYSASSPESLPTKPLADDASADSSTEDEGLSTLPEESRIRPFWRKWGEVMYAARPRGKPIKLSGTASTTPPSDPNGSRTPYSDRLDITDAQLEMLRNAHWDMVRRLERLNDDDTSVFSGRGVVMVGGGEYYAPALIGIQMLRRTGSRLPVEVFVPNHKEYEKEICEKYLPRLNAKCVVLSDFQKHYDEGRGMEIKHYQLKAPALLLSSFSEVLLLDSDSMPMVDPSLIFDTEPYMSSGLITWPDFWTATESPRFWDIAGMISFPEGLPPASSESGQLVINKRTHLAPLLLATYYNLFGSDFYYPLLSQGALGQGDKETFMAAAVALNMPHYRVRTGAKSLGRHDGHKTKGTAIVQHLPADDASSSARESGNVRAAFLHSNTPKMNAGHLVDEGDLVAADGHTRLRLLGSKEDLLKLFGYDVEDVLWDLLVQTGCELAETLEDWKSRKNLCERLKQHHEAVFPDDQ